MAAYRPPRICAKASRSANRCGLREITDMERDLQRRQREFREDLNQRRNEELAGVVEQANQAIRKIAESEKFDVIFQEAVYASPRIDITDKVLRALGTKASGK